MINIGFRKRRATGARWLLASCAAAVVAVSPQLAGQGRAGTQSRVEVEGVLEVYHEDSSRGSRLIHVLNTGTERILLEWGGRRQLPSATRIRVRGAMRNGTLALDSNGGDSSGVETIALASPSTFGPQSTLVILFNFQDFPIEPYTTASAHSVTFTQVNDFYIENSYGQTSLDGTVVGWYTIPSSHTWCNYTLWAQQADQAATAAGVNVASFFRRVYGFPQTSACAWSGLGTVGGGTKFFASRAWVNGDYALQAVAHELGHNFGLHHARSETCDAGGCVITEYGDDHDIMGAAVSGHFSAYQKDRLGWLAYGSSPPIQSVTRTGEYTLEAYAASSGGLPKALKILSSSAGGSNTYIYAEARTQIGTDSDLAPGVIIHTGLDTDGREVYEIDLQPSSSTTDFILDPGQSVTFDDITITTLSSGSFGAVLGVTLPSAGTATSLTPGAVTGIYGGTTTLTATLTADGAPVQGRTVAFSLNGTAVGSALTDTSGVATLSGVSLAGFNATIYPAAVAATFAGDSSYDESNGTNSLTVEPKPVAPHVTAADKVYDASNAATLVSCTVSGIVASDDVACSGTATFDTSDAGTGKTVTAIGLMLAGAADNYVLTTTTATTTAAITPRVVTLSVAVAAKSYDGTTAATLISCALTSVLGGIPVGCTGTAAFDTASVGTDKTVTVSGLTLTGTAAGNYALAFTTATTTAAISQRPVTASVTVSDKSYDGTTSATLTSCTLTGIRAGEIVACTGTAAFDTANPGKEKTVTVSDLTLTGPAAGNYVTSTIATTTAAIVARQWKRNGG